MDKVLRMSSTYMDGEAGGLEAARRGVGEQGRRDGRLPQATRRQHRRPAGLCLLPLFLGGSLCSVWILSANG
jgi:hypothetical protein